LRRGRLSAGLAISEADIQVELDRRKPGTSRHVTQRREPDTVEILSGVFEGAPPARRSRC
jgi:chorismate synthase